MKYLFAPVILIALALSACGGDDDREVVEKLVVNSPTKDGGRTFRDPEFGEEVWLGVGAMSGVEGVNANGVAQANYYEGGLYRHSVQLNIERAPKDHFYEGWVVKEGEEPISTGHVKSRLGDVRHALSFDTEQDLREYTTVVITLEPDDGNPAPAEHVAEGTLVKRER